MKTWNIQPESLLRIPGKIWVYWKDIHGIYLGCNDLMAQSLLLGSREDICGMSDFDFSLQHEEAETYRQSDQAVIKSGMTRQFQDTATLSGAVIEFLVIKMPIYENNKIIGIAGMSYYLDESPTDITTSKHPTLEPSPFRLSKRQEECLLHIMNGKTIKETSELLALSPRTIEHYIEALKSKLGCNSRLELIKKVLQLRLITE